MLPLYTEIQKWTDQKLKLVIEAGEQCNWNISEGEDPEEVFFYIDTVYSEYSKRTILTT